MGSKRHPAGVVPVVKNQEILLTGEDIGSSGEGISHYERFTVMVPGLLPEEEARVRIVKVQSHYAYGIVMERLTTSPDRVIPNCPLDSKCGGCQLGHLSYPAQLSFKRQKVKDVLVRIGHFPAGEVEEKLAAETMGMEDPTHYRNKAQFPVQMVAGRAEAGFYAPRSHRLLPVYDCQIQSLKANQLIEKIMDKVREFSLSVYEEETKRGLLRHVLIRIALHTEDISVTFVMTSHHLPRKREWCDYLKSLGVTSFSIDRNNANSNVILGYDTRVLLGEEYITDKIGDMTFQISPTAFYQVNPIQMEKLYGKALEYADLSGKERVLEGYCGIGTISLFLARQAKEVVGIEVVPPAVANARKNAELNHLSNCEFLVGKVEEVLRPGSPIAQDKVDVMVVDPPRAGCDAALIQTMLEFNPEKIVYISCDPATLARDLNLLCHGKNSPYQFVKAQTVDMFPNTAHVETVCLLGRRKPDDTIKVSVNMDDYYQIRDAEEAEKNPS